MSIFKEGQTALVLSPHTDDAELCCGATLQVMESSGVLIYLCNLSLAHGSNESEAMNAVDALGVDFYVTNPIGLEVRKFHERRQDILEFFLTQQRVKDWDFVLVPSTSDTHQDHIVVAEEAFRAFKKKTILAWEAPWNNIGFDPNLYVGFDEIELVRKREAVSCYQSQIREDRDYFSYDYLDSWARFRGGQVGKKYAEAFEIVRLVT